MRGAAVEEGLAVGSAALGCSCTASPAPPLGVSTRALLALAAPISFMHAAGRSPCRCLLLQSCEGQEPWASIKDPAERKAFLKELHELKTVGGQAAACWRLGRASQGGSLGARRALVPVPLPPRTPRMLHWEPVLFFFLALQPLLLPQ